MAEVLWLGVALGVGPVFLAIVQQSTARGVGAGCRVSLGATACDALLLLTVLLFVGAFAGLSGTAPWLGALGALCFLYLGQAAGRDARRHPRGLGRDRWERLGVQQYEPPGGEATTTSRAPARAADSIPCASSDENGALPVGVTA